MCDLKLKMHFNQNQNSFIGQVCCHIQGIWLQLLIALKKEYRLYTDNKQYIDNV